MSARPGPATSGATPDAAGADVACRLDPETGRCATCADEALEGRILEIGADALARVDLGGRIMDVALDLVDDAAVGDRVLVHAGVAIARVRLR